MIRHRLNGTSGQTDGEILNYLSQRQRVVDMVVSDSN
jgi:hypothetical protein